LQSSNQGPKSITQLTTLEIKDDKDLSQFTCFSQKSIVVTGQIKFYSPQLSYTRIRTTHKYHTFLKHVC